MTQAAARSVAVGDAAPRRLFGPITRGDIVRYAGASGDFNPLHYDDSCAQAAGFPTVFSMGMFQAGLLATFATDWLGAETIRRFTVRFKEQVWPGDVLVCEGTVTDVSPDGELSRITVELTCSRKQGGAAIAATAEFLLPTTSPEVTSLETRKSAMTVAGSWNLTINAGPTPETATLTLEDAAEGVTGSLSSRQAAGDLLDVAVEGEQIAFKVAIAQPLPMTLEFSGTVDEPDMSGSVKLGAFGSGTWTATRA